MIIKLKGNKLKKIEGKQLVNHFYSKSFYPQIIKASTRPKSFLKKELIKNLKKKKKKRKKHKILIKVINLLNEHVSVRFSYLCTVLLVSVGFVCTRREAHPLPSLNFKTFATRPKQWPPYKDPYSSPPIVDR